MTLALTDFSRALVTIDDVLRVNDGQKQGEWERLGFLANLERAVAHGVAAQSMLADDVPLGERYREHSFDEHVSHAATRLIFALELLQRERQR